MQFNIAFLGIDPGPTYSAFVEWTGTEIGAKGIVETKDLVSTIKDIDAPWAVEHIASYGMAVGKEIFETCYWIGELRLAARQQGIMFLPVFRKQVVLHHCLSPRATDSNVRQALIDRLGPPGTKKSPGATYGVAKDMWSALAIALYAADISVS